jgi:quercetin dioxygenase-like cupin family protein
MTPIEWNNIPREPLADKLTRQAFHTAEMTIGRFELLKGCVLPKHAHANAQVSMVQSGRLRFTLPEGEFEVGPGALMPLDPNLSHGVEALEDSVVIDVFTPPRADWQSGADAYLRR